MICLRGLVIARTINRPPVTALPRNILQRTTEWTVTDRVGQNHNSKVFCDTLCLSFVQCVGGLWIGCEKVQKEINDNKSSYYAAQELALSF